jgi:hypothetical protein
VPAHVRPISRALPSRCSANTSGYLATHLANLPSGAIFHGSGCYSVPNGIKLTKPVTIDGGTYDDPSTTKPTGKGYDGMKPVFEIYDTKDVTLENLHVVGSNPTGVYHAKLVGQTGIRVLSSDHVTIRNVTTDETWGDGLTLFANFPKDGRPVTNLLVTNFTVSKAGRQGITPADVFGATFRNITITGSADRSWDFESDLRRVGTGDMTVTNCTFNKGLEIEDYLTGPLTFNNCSGSAHIHVGSEHSQQPITFNGGTILLRPDDHGTPPGGITMNGGNLIFNGTKIGHLPSTRPPTGPAWVVLDGAHLTFNHSSIDPPLGVRDSTSTVTVSPPRRNPR